MQTIVKSNTARLASLLILTTSLVACGGGGGGTDSAATTANQTTSPTVPVASSSMNQAPTISGAALTSVAAGKAYSFVPSAADADGDSLQFSISSKPSWAAFDVATGRLSGTPTSANVGAYEEIEISVTDGKSSAKLAQFAISVEASSATTRNVTVSWQPPTTNSDGSTLTNLNGYRILYGVKSGQYTQSVTVSGAGLARFTIDNLQSNQQYYVAMVAVNSAGVESDKSAEVVVDAS